jgi:hypothetical protein
MKITGMRTQLYTLQALAREISTHPGDFEERKPPDEKRILGTKAIALSLFYNF